MTFGLHNRVPVYKMQPCSQVNIKVEVYLKIFKSSKFLKYFRELLQLAVETGFVKNEKLPELDELGKLRVQLEKTQMKLQDQSQNIEAMTNCTICEEFVSQNY